MKVPHWFFPTHGDSFTVEAESEREARQRAGRLFSDEKLIYAGTKCETCGFVHVDHWRCERESSLRPAWSLPEIDR